MEIATSPSELPTAINIDLTAEVRSVALLTLSQVYLQRGEYEPAKTVLYQALEHPPADPAALANLRYRLGQAYLGGEYADLDEAIWRFTEVLSVQPRSPTPTAVAVWPTWNAGDRATRTWPSPT